MQRDHESRFIYDLAAYLKKTVGEILDMPAEEFRGWSIYLTQNRKR